MKRIIYYRTQDDNGITITTYTKKLLTKDGDDFIEKLHRFYEDNSSNNIVGIQEKGEFYDLTTYLNYHMSRNLYDKMMLKYYGKRN